MDTLDLDQLKLPTEVLPKDLSELFSRHLSADMEYRLKKDDKALQQHTVSLKLKTEIANSILIFVEACQEESETLAARLRKILRAFCWPFHALSM